MVREKLGKKEKSGKVCSCIWPITTSIDLDTKCAKKELFTRYRLVLHLYTVSQKKACDAIYLSIIRILIARL